MKNLLKFLQSNQAVLIGAILALATQLWHSVRAFVLLDVGGADNLWNYLFGILFSISTSFAILLFTVRGRKGWAYFFLAVEVFINLIHYSVLDMPLGPILFATIFMCLIVPVTISIYSAEIDVNEDDKVVLKWSPDKKNVYVSGVDPYTTEDGNAPNIGFYRKGQNGEIEKYDPPQKKHDAKTQLLLNEVKEIAGYDISDPTVKSNVPIQKRTALRKLWDERNTMEDKELKIQVQRILTDTGVPLFGNNK